MITGNVMIKSGQTRKLPKVSWQSDQSDAYAVFRLAEKDGKKPADGHDPRSPHRIRFHAIFLVTAGSFDHWMDFETYRLRANQLVYISPSQIHHFMSSKKPKKAWVLIFRPELLPHGLLGNVVNQPHSWSIVSYLWPSLTMLQNKEKRLLEDQLQLIERLQTIDSMAATHFVCGFIATAFQFAKRHNKEAATWQANERFFEFVELAEENFQNRRDVKWYASQMQCSSRTINRACQQQTSISAKAFLTQRVIVEAKRMLMHGLEPVSVVAEALGFADSTNFVRLFKNQVDLTPQAFRTMYQRE